MTLLCEKCGGTAEPAAQLKTFEYEGQTLRCLMFVSSCVVCGHHWKDETYAAANLHHVERACAIAAARYRPPVDTQSSINAREQENSAA
jgi:hypothetical protein